MIFALTADENGIFLMLSEQDVKQLREGKTKFVDQRHLHGRRFKQVIVSLHKTDDAALRLLKDAGQLGAGVKVETDKVAEPAANEGRCQRCGGLIPIVHLFEDTCITCWAALAKQFQKEAN